MAAKGRIRGLPELSKALAKLPKVVEAGSRRAVREQTKETAQDLRRNAPVLSGKLKRSIQEEILKGGLTGRAVITAPHAKFVIHGTSKQEPNDFLAPAERRARERWPKAVEKAVREELKRL